MVDYQQVANTLAEARMEIEIHTWEDDRETICAWSYVVDSFADSFAKLDKFFKPKVFVDEVREQYHKLAKIRAAEKKAEKEMWEKMEADLKDIG